jgi:hypothetical protein
MKKCPKCKIEKINTEFSKNKSCKDGLSVYCKSCVKIYAQINKEKIAKYKAEYRIQHAQEIKEYFDSIKEERKEYKKQYELDHKDIRRKWNRENSFNRRHNDINFKLRLNLRSRLSKAIKRNQKAGSAVRDLGCSIPFLKDYIASKFYGDMSWDNYGVVWELDHIEELHTFDLTDPIQFRKAVHYTNLQPLTIEDHKKKTSMSIQNEFI